MEMGPVREFNQDPGVNAPTDTKSAMGVLNDRRESGHPFNVPSERWHPTQGNVPFTALGHWDLIILRPERSVPHTGPPTPLPAASGPPSRNRSGPTLLSFRGKLAVGCRVVCCW